MFLFCLGIVLWMLHPYVYRYYFTSIKKMPSTITPYVFPTSACLPPGTALAFVDSNNLRGYLFVEHMKYGQVDYVIKVFGHPAETIQHGRLTIWKDWPWSSLSSHKENVYLGDETYPHFAWLPPYCIFHFDRSKIQRVCITPLEKTKTPPVDEIWIDTDFIGDGQHDK